MKERRKQLILLTAVVLIWGVVGWQLYGFISPEEPISAFKNETIEKTDTLTVQPYQLIASYKDPFLKNTNRQTQGAVVTPKTVVSPKKTETKSAEPVNWAVIKFLGTVENEHTKDRVALVSFKGKMLMLKRNEAIEGFKMIKVYKDSLQVGYSNQSRTFLRGQ